MWWKYASFLEPARDEHIHSEGQRKETNVTNTKCQISLCVWFRAWALAPDLRQSASPSSTVLLCLSFLLYKIGMVPSQDVCRIHG